MMAITPIGEAAMSLIFRLFACMLPVFGAITDSDGDGVKTLWDCDDSDAALKVLWCFDSDGDGAGECVTPVPEVCLPDGQAPDDPRYTPCTCTRLEIL